LKKSVSIILSCVFIFTFVFSSTAAATTYSQSCSASAGSYADCYNNISNVSDDLAYFSDTLDDYYNPTDAYHIKFIDSSTYPNVTRGTPIYKDDVLTDNKNNTYYTYSNWNGLYLNDYSSLSMSIQKTTGYYPASYERPVTTLDIKSGDATACSTKPWACNTYTHANQYDVN